MIGRVLAAIVLVASCGANGKEAVGPVGALVPKLPDGPPLVTPGERMSYRVSVQGLELASYDVAVGNMSEVEGHQAIVVQAHAKTVGLAGAMVKVDDYFSSWIDVTNGRSLRWSVDEYATNAKDKERTLADLAARKADILPITFHLNDDPPAPEPQKVSLPDVWDYNAFMIALRSWEGPPGTKVVAEVLRSRYLWHVEMTIHGKDKVVTELGELPALRFDGHTYKLNRSGGRYPNSDERDFSIWISDDADRVPLKIVARTDYGDMKMDIVEYVPGTGQHLRR